MEGDLYLIVGTPNSGATETLSLGLDDKDQESPFLIPRKNSSEWNTFLACGRWKMVVLN